MLLFIIINEFLPFLLLYRETFDNQDACRPQKNIFFLKTHKTGSSTMTNIFNRFAETHHLTMALPKDGFYNFLWPLPFQSDFTNDAIKPNILSNHARFNPESFQELMPTGTRYVTILRNPLTQYPSLFKFMDLASVLNLNSNQKHWQAMEYFLNNSYNILKSLQQHNPQVLVDNPSLYLLRNPQFFDLGFEPLLSDDENRVHEKLTEIAKYFKLVLIMEHFDESLVLLKRKMCWNINDIVYFKHNMQIKTNEVPSSQSTEVKIFRWNRADVILYNYFNKSLWDSIKGEGMDFWKDVALLRQKNNELIKTCLKKGQFFDRPYAGSTSLIYGHSLRADIPFHWKQVCERMTRSEMKYIDYFRFLYQTK